ncbi:MAG: hypothetical protein C0624_12435 [Desulfuromonas sp.]|nr:MAG: hypothetical protein C0624_12435 [Desulfuromonas sp.]
MWPLLDYRSSELVDYHCLHLFGPLFKFEAKESEYEWALRPLWYHATLPDQEVSLDEFVYPLYQRTRTPEATKSVTFNLFRAESSPDEESFSLYPLLFYRRSEQRGNEFALFPLAGHLEKRLGRRKIDFALFPLYSRTLRYEGAVTHNLLWPIFHIKHGPDNESGWGIWPLYGQGQRDRSYRERFVAWPFVVLRDEYRDGVFVPARRSYFPFYIRQLDEDFVETTLLWPFLAYRENTDEAYREWDIPWPLVRISRGEGKHVNRFLPFYADETYRRIHKRWIVWPVYKFEEMWTPDYDRNRHRVLFFLYDSLKETDPQSGELQRQHTALWPLMSFVRHGQVRELRVLSLLDPIFPERPPLERNWEPLWRLFARRWDPYGNSALTVFWNLYWQERRGDDVARELFPLFDYRREGNSVNFGLLKGLIRYRSENGHSRLSFFFF